MHCISRRMSNLIIISTLLLVFALVPGAKATEVPFSAGNVISVAFDRVQRVHAADGEQPTNYLDLLLFSRWWKEEL
jgi:hypothetical protein